MKVAPLFSKKVNIPNTKNKHVIFNFNWEMLHHIFQNVSLGYTEFLGNKVTKLMLKGKS